MGQPLKVERSPREVIASKLLTVLDETDNVAIVASEEDLAMLIAGLKNLPREWTRASEFAADLARLKEEAFGT